MVDGDHRVGIFANKDIRHSELFYNYNYNEAAAPDWHESNIEPIRIRSKGSKALKKSNR